MPTALRKSLRSLLATVFLLSFTCFLQPLSYVSHADTSAPPLVVSGDQIVVKGANPVQPHPPAWSDSLRHRVRLYGRNRVL